MSEPVQFPKHVAVTVNGPSTEGLAVCLRFGMRMKNSFSYLVFLNSRGFAEIDGNDLLKTFDQERNAFIMDYGDPRICFSGEIEAKVLGKLELESALDAFRMFKGNLSYPENYEAHLDEALRRGQTPEDYQVEVVTK